VVQADPDIFLTGDTVKKMTMTKELTPTAFNQQPDRQRDSYHGGDHDNYQMLMSLALDNLLDSSEEEALALHLSSCSPCNRQWQIWQKVDQQFEMAPLLVEPLDFASAVAARIAVKERRRQAQVGLLLAILTFAVWAIGFAGMGLLLGFVLYSQVTWFGETLHWLAYAWTSASVVVSSLWGILLSLSDNPSAIVVVACYIILAVVSLVGWTHFLRRTTHPLDVRSA
jgi:predicted anti-sigma-YlaC factor YlaD